MKRKGQDTNEESKWLSEKYRPQFHFTPVSGWMNDPNGLVYFEGEYHLFYQYNPDSTVWGVMHWGHAVSADMIHWQHLPIALYPDSIGWIFSGSAVVDRNNTSGLGSGANPPLVAIFTYHNMAGEKAGLIDIESQGIAYSLDKGRTWKMDEDNPVLPNPNIRDFRDPKVSSNDLGKQWIMTLAVQDHIEFYGSPDLKQWTKLSEFGSDTGGHGGVWECPDLFSLTDEAGITRWVLLVSINPGGPQGGSATQYFIGDFDGKKFSPQDTVTRWIDYGADNYAGVTWSDIPAKDGRRLFVGWMSNWQYAQSVPTESWRSAMTLPREILLVKNGSVFELKSKPVKELNTILENPEEFTEQANVGGKGFVVSWQDEGMEKFDFILSNDEGDKVLISMADKKLTFDRSNSGVTDFHNAFPAAHTVDMNSISVWKVELFVDQASVELFINDGERVMTELVFPQSPWTKVKLTKTNSKFQIKSIKPVW
jgi:fructan beta-fructosidase